MSLLDPRELLSEVINRYVAWSVLITMAVSAVILVLYVIVLWWPFFLGGLLGFIGGWVVQARRGW